MGCCGNNELPPSSDRCLRQRRSDLPSNRHPVLLIFDGYWSSKKSASCWYLFPDSLLSSLGGTGICRYLGLVSSTSTHVVQMDQLRLIQLSGHRLLRRNLGVKPPASCYLLRLDCNLGVWTVHQRVHSWPQQCAPVRSRSPSVLRASAPLFCCDLLGSSSITDWCGRCEL
jgi:hypothetical protein